MLLMATKVTRHKKNRVNAVIFHYEQQAIKPPEAALALAVSGSFKPMLT